MTIKSPQFHREWLYTVTFPQAESSSITIDTASSYENLNAIPLPVINFLSSTSVENGSSETEGNKFVEDAIVTALAYVRAVNPSALSAHSDVTITLQASPGFYSTPPSSDPFPPCAIVPSDSTATKQTVQINKTGMGSSACLVTSTIGVLLSLYSQKKQGHERTVLHNLSQISHCVSQGKVGSGFDVAAAVYGGSVYTRFPTNVIDAGRPLSEGVGRLCYIAEGRGRVGDDGVYDPQAEGGASPLWGACATPPPPFSLHSHGLHLVMADVRGGSDSPSMAKAVLRWRDANTPGEGADIWEAIGAANTRMLTLIEGGVASDGELAEHYREVRRLLKRMGDKAGVSIEPDEQTALCDETMAIDGVVFSGVPGAGGVDAAFAVVRKNSEEEEGEVLSRIDQVWKRFGGGGKVERMLIVEGKQGGVLECSEMNSV